MRHSLNEMGFEFPFRQLFLPLFACVPIGFICGIILALVELTIIMV